MNSRLTTRTRALSLPLIGGLAILAATAAFSAENQDKPVPAPGWSNPPRIDQQTGLPLPPAPPWKDPEWTDPGKILKELTADAVPLAEVVRHLRREFQDAFDILIPNSWQDPNNPAVAFDPQSLPVRLQLKNVTATEVFNAMNLMFELESTPCRWELRLNGHRPLAMLRVLRERLPPAAFLPDALPAPTTRMVYFVGDLVRDGPSGGNSMQQLVKTVSEVYEMSFGPPKGVLQFHAEAQLIIVRGTADQIQFVQQTLSALREKARAVSKPEPKPAKPSTKPTETKPL